MTNKSESSRILTAIHETAQDLHHAGFIDNRRMRHFDALGFDPIPPASTSVRCAIATS
jgi:putative transcriptional regulator